MGNKITIKTKIIITILISVCSAIFFMCAMYYGQNTISMNQFQKEMASDVQNLMNNYDEASKRHEYITKSFDNIYESDVKLLSLLFIDDYRLGGSWLMESLKVGDRDLYAELIKLNEFFNFKDLMIIDREGNIIAAANNYYSYLDEDVYAPLREYEFGGWDDAFSLHVLSEEDASLKYADVTEENLEGDDIQLTSNMYATEIVPGYILVIAEPFVDESILESQSDAWTVLMQNETIGEQGYAFVWSEETKKILYHPDSEYKYQDVETLGMNMDNIRDGEYGWNVINGSQMYVYSVYDKEHDVWIACAVSGDEMINSRRGIALIQGLIFALLAAAVAYYVILLLKEDKIKVSNDVTGAVKRKNVHQSRQYKLLVITITISSVMMFFTFYLHTLYPMSFWAESSERQTQSIQSTVTINESQAKTFTNLYANAKNQQLSGLAKYISAKDNTEQDDISYYGTHIGAMAMQILDKNGKEVPGMTYMSKSSEISSDNEDENADFLKKAYNQDNEKDIFDWMSDGRTDVQNLQNEDGNTGYLATSYYSKEVDNALKSYSLAGTLQRVSPGRNGFVFSVDRTDNTILYHPDEEMIGANALEYGLKEGQIKDNYCDYITLGNIDYYATTDSIGNNIIFYIVSKDMLLSSRLNTSLTSVLLALVLFLLIGIMLYTSREQVEEIPVDSVRWSTNEEKNSAEYKIMRILLIYIALAAFLFMILSFFPDTVTTGTVLGYVLAGNWERGVNVFALTASIIILCRGGIILLFINRMINALGNVLPIRIGTILKMFASLSIYITIGFLLYQCMVCFGLNPTALMASTGVIAVVLGIGANSLVGDVIAGIFILMEGNIQVGDVVQINNFRGYVIELGIRMTKLYDMDKDDVKIIPNNEMRNVVHMSMCKAVVYSEFQICYEEKLEDVEKILTEELKNVKDKSPYILEGPVYLGVSKLGDSGVCLKTSTKCHEAFRKRVEREVNHIVYSIFQKNNITVPYNQVTLHTGDDSPIVRDVNTDKTDN